MWIIHGQNLVLSRKKLGEKIEAFRLKHQAEIIRLEGKKFNLTQAKQLLEATSLFGQRKLIIVENFFSLPQSKQKKETLDYLKEKKPENLIIWENRKIDGRRLMAFSQTKIQRFDLPPLIFKFLDSFAPENKKFSLNLLHQLLHQEAPELIFYLLARRIGQLIIAKDLGKRGLTQMARWQQEKLLYQAKKFDLKKLLLLYQQLLKIDYQQKTGRTSLPLSFHLDLFIASL